MAGSPAGRPVLVREGDLVPERRSNRHITRIVGGLLAHPPAVSVAVVALLLVLSFGLTVALGGAHRVAPHWFYAPILLAGVRFGLAGAFPVAAVATLLAGPLTPGDVEAGTPQDPTDWLVRGLFFVIIGVGVSVGIRQALQAVLSEHRSQRRLTELRRAMAAGEVELHYQPVVDLEDGRIVGAEALVRWNHPTRGLLPPADFIEDFEQLDESTDWVIGRAAATVGDWKERLGLDHFHVAVNISGHDLGRAGLPERVQALLAPTGLSPSDLCLEVTESAVVQDLDEAAATLAALRLGGTTIAIDDLGTGHATLAYVQRLPLDVVKIDRTFTAELLPGSPSEAIIAALTGLSRQLGADCIAEGIENEDQRAAVVRHGCRRGQGFLFSPAVPADRFEQMLIARLPASPGPWTTS